MKITSHKIKRGFTLLELTLAMLIGMVIGGIVLAMLNQQLAFLRIFRAQSFLSEEAPLISNHVSKLLANAERFRLVGTMAEAMDGVTQTSAESDMLVLNFRQPDGTVRTGILSFETLNNIEGLYYYVVPNAGVRPAPQWAITTRPADVDFFMQAGIMCCRLTGPAGEQIIFSGAMQ